MIVVLDVKRRPEPVMKEIPAIPGIHAVMLAGIYQK